MFESCSVHEKDMSLINCTTGVLYKNCDYGGITCFMVHPIFRVKFIFEICCVQNLFLIVDQMKQQTRATHEVEGKETLGILLNIVISNWFSKFLIVNA